MKLSLDFSRWRSRLLLYLQKGPDADTGRIPTVVRVALDAIWATTRCDATIAGRPHLQDRKLELASRVAFKPMSSRASKAGKSPWT